ncbi:hypothetical protein B0H21DRAFT_173028 [Amylocystis lapponica]|nr:hypothetical protein B0H21DRAFT_173028 [Amylocystis lapponica]
MSSPIVEVTEDETGPVLPLEITDHIIDYLRGRSTALCNCALTCHAWLPRSRYNLFLKMFIGSFASLEALVSVSRMPHMLPHFKELYQLRLHTSDVWWPPESRHVMRPITDRPFVHLLPLFFPQLLQTAKVLKICFTDWSAFPSHPATQFHQSTLPSLTHLTLNSCTFGSLNQCVRLISAFPSLSHLSLFDIAWHNHGSIGTACYAPRPVLQSFELKGIHPERDMIILEWISMAHQKAHSLRHLDLELSDPHSETLDPRSETLRRIALSIGLHLRSLHIRSYADDAGNTNRPSPDYRACLLTYNGACLQVTNRSSPLALICSHWAYLYTGPSWRCW